MPVNTPDISIDPYKSQVPLVQIPQEDLQRPQVLPEQAGYMGKTGSIMGLADSLMKGTLKGLQLKEEKKFKTAQAVMGAQDAAIAAAKKHYEDLLVTNGAFEADGKTPKADTQAAYAAYQDTVNKAAEARQAFAVPEKAPKQPKGQKKDQKAADGAPAAGGFGAGLKQFFERNPHIIPEIAIIGMKAGVTPYGQTTPEIEQAKADQKRQQREAIQGDITLAEAQRKQAAQKTYDLYSGLNAEELAALPREEQQKFQSAKDIVFPPYQTRTTREYVSPDGARREWFIPGAEPDGWNAVATGSSQAKPGTESEYTARALSGYGYTADNAPAPLLKYLHDNWQWKQSQTTTGAHEVLQPDPVTHKMVAVTVGSSTTKGAPAPKPPAGFSPLNEQGVPEAPQSAPPQAGSPKPAGKMTAPPAASKPTAAAKPSAAGKGAMTPPPTGVKGLRNTGLESMTADVNTQKVENEKTTRYQKAEDSYKKALDTNQKEYEKKANSLLKAKQWNEATKKTVQGELDAANAKSLQELENEKNEIGKWYQQQVHAIGGNVPEDNSGKTPPPGATMVYKDSRGIIRGYAVNGQYVAAGSQ